MPWTNDLLRRSEFGSTLNTIIDNGESFRKVSDDSLVIALDSSYGSGKTTFLDMWLKSLRLDSDKLIIKINSWTSDDYNNPLVPFMYEFQTVFDDSQNKLVKEHLNDELVKRFQTASFKTFFRLGYRILDTVIERKMGLNLDDVVQEYKEIENDLTKCTEKYNEVINDFKC